MELRSRDTRIISAQMLEHLLFDFANSLKASLGASMLERSGLEEQFHMDLILGDATFETSWSLPGESDPPRVRADISVEWPTWSQSSYRSWMIGDGLDEPIELIIEVAIRFSGLKEPMTNPVELTHHLPEHSASLHGTSLELRGVSAEATFDATTKITEYSAEAVYEATLALDEAVLSDPSQLNEAIAHLIGWISSVLVKASDIPLSYHQL
jgi:hypothetical protein